MKKILLIFGVLLITGLLITACANEGKDSSKRTYGGSSSSSSDSDTDALEDFLEENDVEEEDESDDEEELEEDAEESEEEPEETTSSDLGVSQDELDELRDSIESMNVDDLGGLSD
jgi:FtsZ-interacting cell division protein ZipA